MMNEKKKKVVTPAGAVWTGKALFWIPFIHSIPQNNCEHVESDRGKEKINNIIRCTRSGS